MIVCILLECLKVKLVCAKHLIVRLLSHFLFLQKALNAIASDVGATLQVTKDGDIVYVVPKDVRSILTQKSFRQRLVPILRKLGEGGLLATRISFGVMLVASVVLVWAAIISLQSSSNDRESRDRDR